MKLEPKHLVIYLPYGLKLKFDDSSEIWGIYYRDETDYSEMLYPLSTLAYTIDIQKLDPINWKPILKPLSDYEDINGKAMNDLNCDLTDQIDIQELASQRQSLQSTTYGAVEIMAENHIDMYGLIPAGLAIDKNTLN